MPLSRDQRKQIREEERERERVRPEPAVFEALGKLIANALIGGPINFFFSHR